MLSFTVLLPGRCGRFGDPSPLEDVQAAELLEAGRQGLRGPEQDGRSDLQAALRSGDRYQEREPEVVESARTAKDPVQLE